jgi:hypothetical protein
MRMNRTNRNDVMTETTATTGASAESAETQTAEGSAIPEAEPAPGSSGAAPSGGSPAPGRPAVTLAGGTGEQTLPIPGAEPATTPQTGGPVPAGGRERSPYWGTDRASGGSASGSASVPGGSYPRPVYTRPPGMAPPPDQPGFEPGRPAEPTAGVQAAVVLSGQAGSYPYAGSYATLAPVSAPPRATGRAPAGGVTVRPIGAGGSGTAIGAAPVTERLRPRPAATPRGPRRARLGLKRIDPWSVMKFSFAVSLVMFIVVIVAASVLYLALDTMGVFESINSTVADLVDAGGGESGETFQITAQGVVGTSAVFGALNVLLFTSLATLGAFIYNVCADLVGGVEVTLAERD